MTVRPNLPTLLELQDSGHSLAVEERPTDVVLAELGLDLTTEDRATALSLDDRLSVLEVDA